MKKIWIDIDNSPHVPFFSPITSELAIRGYDLIITARDAYQVKELLNVYQLPAKIIGRHYGKHKIMKMAGCVYRMLQLAPLVMNKKPDVAVSHGSRSMLFLSKLLRIPLVTIFDYEFGQTNPSIKPDLVITPEIVTHVPFYQTRVLKYNGIKEDVYVPFFKPNSGLKSELGLDNESIIVTLRPPATEAHYHNSDSEILFDEVIDFLAEQKDIQMVVLPRNARQAETIKVRWARLYAKRKLIIPPPLHGLSILWNSDVVISGGGTMNREAAALGVPVYSIFRGKMGAVDLYLEREGKLTFIQDRNDIRDKIDLKKRKIQPIAQSNKVLDQIVSFIVLFLEHPQDIASRYAYDVQFEQRPLIKFIHGSF